MKSSSCSLILCLGMSLPAWAETSVGHSGMNHAAMNQTAGMSSALSEGLVVKTDPARGKLTLQHGPLENLNMPGMTMLFRVADPAFLKQIKPGDKVRFRVERVKGKLTVTQLEAMP